MTNVGVLMAVLVFFRVGSVYAQEAPPMVRSIKVIQLHTDYNEKPHRYSLEIITAKAGDYQYTWESVSCGYFVGQKSNQGEYRDRTIEWRYDTPGECEEARLTIVVKATGNIGQRLSSNVWPPYNPEVMSMGPRESKVLQGLTKEQCEGYGRQYNQEAKGHRGVVGWFERGYLSIIRKFTSSKYFLAVNERARGKLFDLWDRVKACEKLYGIQYDNLDKSPCAIVEPGGLDEIRDFRTVGICAIKG